MRNIAQCALFGLIYIYIVISSSEKVKIFRSVIRVALMFRNVQLNTKRIESKKNIEIGFFWLWLLLFIVFLLFI